MTRAWVKPISYKKYLIENLPIRKVVRQHLNFMRGTGFCTRLIGYAE
jgi:hypothetical protein